VLVSESDSSGASYSETSSSVLSLSSDTSHESTDSRNGALEPYLYEPLESLGVSLSDTYEDDDSQDSQSIVISPDIETQYMLLMEMKFEFYKQRNYMYSVTRTLLPNPPQHDLVTYDKP